MEQATLTLNGQDYVLKQSFRGLMLYEDLFKKSVSEMGTTIEDLINLLYCMLRANNKDTFSYTLDEFIDLLDENPQAITHFNNYLSEQSGDTDDKKKE